MPIHRALRRVLFRRIHLHTMLLVALITCLVVFTVIPWSPYTQLDHLAEARNAHDQKCRSDRSPVLKLVQLKCRPVPEDAIHFILSDGSNDIKPREICSIESAAALHPDTPVVVNLLSPELVWTGELEALKTEHPNVKFLQLDVRDRLSGTPLGGEWLDKGLLYANKEYRTNYISDICRMATVYKYGGAYMDMDMLVLKPLNGLHNSLPVEGDGSYANANFLSFDKGHPLLLDILQYLSKNFRTDKYTANGPPAVTEILIQKGWCSVDDSRRLQNCTRGLNLLPAETVNPVDYHVARDLFMSKRAVDAEILNGQIRDAHAVHLYNFMTKEACIELCPGVQTIVDLVWRTCPGLAEQMCSKGGRF